MKNEILTNPKLIGCATCGGAPAVKLPKDALCCVGFGLVTLEIDDETAWCGDDETVSVAFLEDRYCKALQASECATLDFSGPLHSERYEYNKANGEWYLIEQGQGFA